MCQTAAAATTATDDVNDNDEAAEVHGKVGDGGGRHCNNAKKS